MPTSTYVPDAELLEELLDCLRAAMLDRLLPYEAVAVVIFSAMLGDGLPPPSGERDIPASALPLWKSLRAIIDRVEQAAEEADRVIDER